MAKSLVNPAENRVIDAISLRTETDARYVVDNRVALAKDPHLLETKKRHYEGVVQSYKKGKELTRPEKASLGYVRHEIRKLDRRLKPTFVKKILYNPVISFLVNWLVGRQGNYKAHTKHMTTQEKEATTNYNVVKLGQDLEKIGFTQKMEGALRKHMAHDLPEFILPYYDIKHPHVNLSLRFLKTKDAQAYLLADYMVAPQQNMAALNAGMQNASKKTYSALDPAPFTLAEAVNIAYGRPVQKEVEGQKMWFADNGAGQSALGRYRFDPEKELNQWPIEELRKPVQRQNLLNSLSEGNLREVTFALPNGTTEKVRVAINSEVSGLHFYNGEGRVIDAYSLLEKNKNLEKLHAKARQLRQQPEPARKLP